MVEAKAPAKVGKEGPVPGARVEDRLATAAVDYAPVTPEVLRAPVPQREVFSLASEAREEVRAGELAAAKERLVTEAAVAGLTAVTVAASAAAGAVLLPAVAPSMVGGGVGMLGLIGGLALPRLSYDAFRVVQKMVQVRLGGPRAGTDEVEAVADRLHAALKAAGRENELHTVYSWDGLRETYPAKHRVEPLARLLASAPPRGGSIGKQAERLSQLARATSDVFNDEVPPGIAAELAEHVVQLAGDDDDALIAVLERSRAADFLLGPVRRAAGPGNALEALAARLELQDRGAGLWVPKAWGAEASSDSVELGAFRELSRSLQSKLEADPRHRKPVLHAEKQLHDAFAGLPEADRTRARRWVTFHRNALMAPATNEAWASEALKRRPGLFATSAAWAFNEVKLGIP